MNSMKTPQKMKPSDPSKDDKFKSKTTAHKPSLPDQKTQEQRQDAKKEVPKEGEKEKDKTELKKDGKDDGHKSDSSSKRPNSNRVNCFIIYFKYTKLYYRDHEVLKEVVNILDVGRILKVGN